MGRGKKLVRNVTGLALCEPGERERVCVCMCVHAVQVWLRAREMIWGAALHELGMDKQKGMAIEVDGE